MTGPFRRRFSARSDGRIDFRIVDRERRLIEQLVAQLRELLMGTVAAGDVNPSLRRLFPTAYPDDPGRDGEYQELVRDQLLERRLEQLDRVETTLDVEQLEESDALAWLTVLNDARLVLGTSLDVAEDDDEIPFDSDPADTETYLRAVYRYLGELQSEFIEVLSP